MNLDFLTENYFPTLRRLVGLSVKLPCSSAKEQKPAPTSANATLSSRILNSRRVRGEAKKRKREREREGKEGREAEVSNLAL